MTKSGLDTVNGGGETRKERKPSTRKKKNEGKRMKG